VKNGTETDIGCGGAATNPRCTVGQSCSDHSDCGSNACSYQKKCVERPSCTGHEGGDTCGSGGEGGVGPAQWESCCASAPAGAGGVAMNKYQVTSGRMRAFLERVNGNVRKVVEDARAAGQLHGAKMDAAWDLYLPTAMDGCDQTGTCGTDELSDYAYDDPTKTPYRGIYTSAYRHVGATIFNGENQGEQGCNVGSPGTHTYWMPPDVQSQYFGEPAAEYPQAVYDTKSLNCVDYLMAQAFCIWDGGRLQTLAEYTAAGSAPDAKRMYSELVAQPGPVPWGSPVPHVVGSNSYYGNRFPDATDATLGLPATTSIEWANFFYSYEYPHLVNVDFVVFINAPGRLRARSPNGHADLVGNVIELTSDVNGSGSIADPRSALTHWTANGSWEGHPWGYYEWNFSLLDKYGKMGARCVYPD
jgi:formylglycine-generating enzyme required for sulfatase activity